jgi:hypothetical protein
LQRSCCSLRFCFHNFSHLPYKGKFFFRLKQLYKCTVIRQGRNMDYSTLFSEASLPVRKSEIGILKKINVYLSQLLNTMKTK